MLLITPTLPFVMPPRDLKNRACQNEVEKPKPRHDNTAIRSEHEYGLGTLAGGLEE